MSCLQVGDYVMRSQLDCYDPRLPGTGIFDIKTRAAMPIRHDIMNWEVNQYSLEAIMFVLSFCITQENSGYQINKLQGQLESFEREYYDLIRSAFLKYRCGPCVYMNVANPELLGFSSSFSSFQARIGNMDGVLVAYHNTARIFGFQYIPLEEMDERLYGNKLAGPLVFEKCTALLQIITDEITHHFPEQVSTV